MLCNSQLTRKDLALLNFFLDNNIKQREIVVEQINNSTIMREVDLYYHFLKINPSTKVLLSKDYERASVIQVLYSDVRAPTVLSLYVKDGLIDAFEVYNADNRKIIESELCEGDIYIGMPQLN